MQQQIIQSIYSVNYNSVRPDREQLEQEQAKFRVHKRAKTDNNIINIYGLDQEIKVEKNKLVEPIIDEAFKNEFVISKTKEGKSPSQAAYLRKPSFQKTMDSIYDVFEKTFEKIELESQISNSKPENNGESEAEKNGKSFPINNEINIYNKKAIEKKSNERVRKEEEAKPKKLLYTPKTYNPNLNVKSEGLKKFIKSNSNIQAKKASEKKSIKDMQPPKPVSAKNNRNLKLSKFSRKNQSAIYSKILPPRRREIKSSSNIELFPTMNKMTPKTQSTRFITSASKFIKRNQAPLSNMAKSYTSNFPIKKHKHKTKSLIMGKNFHRDSSPFAKSVSPHQRKTSYNSVNDPKNRHQMKNHPEAISPFGIHSQSREKFRARMKNYIDSAYRNKQSLQTIQSNLSGAPGGRQYTTQSTNLSPHRESQDFYHSEINRQLGQKGRIQFIDLTNNYSQEVNSAQGNEPASRSVVNSLQRRSDTLTWIPDTQSISKEDLENKLLSLFKKVLVYCSKIQLLKEKLLKSKSEFSVYGLFKRFCIKKRELMTPIEFSNFTRLFGFRFPQQTIIKMMLFLKRFKTFMKEGQSGKLEEITIRRELQQARDRVR